MTGLTFFLKFFMRKKNCCSQMSYAPSSGEEESNDEFGERGGGGRPNNQGCKCNRVSLDKSTVGGMTGIQYFSRNILGLKDFRIVLLTSIHQSGIVLFDQKKHQMKFPPPDSAEWIITAVRHMRQCSIRWRTLQSLALYSCSGTKCLTKF